MNSEEDEQVHHEYEAEFYGLQYAAQNGITVPEIIDNGCITHKKEYSYLVMKRRKGIAFQEVCDHSTEVEQVRFGLQLADITYKLHSNTNQIKKTEVFERKLNQTRWRTMTDAFQKERLDYLKMKDCPNVFVHGDLNPENILLEEDGTLSLIDFGDARLAPESYEVAPIVCYLFEFGQSYMKGFFHYSSKNEIIDDILDGILLHEYGANMIKCNFDEFDTMTSVEQLRQKISEKFIMV